MKEVVREFRATEKRRERKANEQLWLAWHIIALDRTDKLPKLDALLIKSTDKKPKKPQDPELLMANVKLAFGYPGEKET